jgi:hypothetical protein
MYLALTTILNLITMTVVDPATPIVAGVIPVLNPTTGQVSVPAGTPAGNFHTITLPNL